jgi:hypothetical protein
VAIRAIRHTEQDEIRVVAISQHAAVSEPRRKRGPDAAPADHLNGVEHADRGPQVAPRANFHHLAIDDRVIGRWQSSEPSRDRAKAS